MKITVNKPLLLSFLLGDRQLAKLGTIYAVTLDAEVMHVVSVQCCKMRFNFSR